MQVITGDDLVFSKKKWDGFHAKQPETGREHSRGHRGLQGRASLAICVRLSPLHVWLAGDLMRRLEKFWHEEKCLAVWDMRN